MTGDMHYGDPEFDIPLCDNDDDSVTERVEAVTCVDCLRELVNIGNRAILRLTVILG
jgi:hypothetical protein